MLYDNDYIGPDRQLPAPAPPDYRLFMQQICEAGRKLEEMAISAWNAIVKAVQPLFDAIAIALPGLAPLFTAQPNLRSRLRLYRHKTQRHEPPDK